MFIACTNPKYKSCETNADKSRIYGMSINYTSKLSNETFSPYLSSYWSFGEKTEIVT